MNRKTKKNFINANKFAENQRYNIEGDESYTVKDLAQYKNRDHAPLTVTM